MMLLVDLIKHIQPIEVVGSTEAEIAMLGLSSQATEHNGLFFALHGETTDGHHFINDAIARGAVAVVCEQLPERLNDKVTYIVTTDSRTTMATMAAEFYGNPSQRLNLVGITGTNGKTTTATLLYRLFRALGYKTGLLSTITNFVDDTEIPATHTTPDIITLNCLLAKMVQAGCTHCFMEVSSHAIIQKRIEKLFFTGSVFSNITHDHLDYHKTFAEYIYAKKQFFDGLSASAFALTNADDKNGMVMVQNTQATVKTYSLLTPANFNCKIVEHSFDGMNIIISGEWRTDSGTWSSVGTSEMWTPLIGSFNAYNLLAVYATAQMLGTEKNETLRILSAMTPIRGRFEKLIESREIKNELQLHVPQLFNQITPNYYIVDYAHTPDALQNVLDTINEIRKHTQFTVSPSLLITVVGCGGNRDTAKRPVMAQIAANNSDRVIFTSDNPRFEEPDDILHEMKSGLNATQLCKSLFITDRYEAIRTAVALAKASNNGAIVLVAGKGHETYQEVKGVRTHFDDKKILQEIINN